MFYRILRSNPEVCKEFIQRLIGVKINKIEYLSAEEPIDDDYRKKGIRMDIYLESPEKIIDVEMQVYNVKNLDLRMRYYQSMIDVDCLEKGQSEDQLKESFILFITNKDYYNKKLPCYTFKTFCEEDKSIRADDKITKVVYNFKRYNEVTDEKRSALLKYFCTKESNDDFTRELDELVETAKGNEPWRKKYMTIEMMMKDYREMGYDEGVVKGAHDKAVETAKKMLKKNIDIKMIMEFTDLSESDILNLKH